MATGVTTDAGSLTQIDDNSHCRLQPISVGSEVPEVGPKGVIGGPQCPELHASLSAILSQNCLQSEGRQQEVVYQLDDTTPDQIA